jgi:hypothetical protein
VVPALLTYPRPCMVFLTQDKLALKYPELEVRMPRHSEVLMAATIRDWITPMSMACLASDLKKRKKCDYYGQEVE